MKNLIKKIIRNENGQSLVIVALLMVVLMVFIAFTIDVGMLHLTKTNMQNAADAAALAGVKDLPDKNKAVITAKNYADKNGADKSKTTVNTNYGSNMIEVVCTKNVKYSFARVFGFTDADVSARAVAEKIPQWAGEALPFVNLDDDYKTDPKIVAWEKTGPGDFESMWKDEYQMYNLGKNDDHSKGYFTIDYQDGIEVTKGTVATVKQEVGYVYEQNKPVYIFSLSSNVIKSGKYNSLSNKQNIPLKDLVLLQVTFDSYDYSGKTLYLTVTGVYDIYNGVFPKDYLNDGTNGTPKLTE